MLQSSSLYVLNSITDIEFKSRSIREFYHKTLTGVMSTTFLQKFLDGKLLLVLIELTIEINCLSTNNSQ